MKDVDIADVLIPVAMFCCMSDKCDHHTSVWTGIQSTQCRMQATCTFAECCLLRPQPFEAYAYVLYSRIFLFGLVSAKAAQTDRLYECHATIVSSRQVELPDQQAPSFI